MINISSFSIRLFQIVSILILLQISSIVAFPQNQPNYSKKNSIEFKKLQSGFPLKTSDFKIAIPEGIITLKITGDGILKLKTGEKRSIKIPLLKNDQITAIQYGVDDKFLYLLFEAYDGEGAGCNISKLHRDTLRILWTNALHGFDCFNSGKSLATRKFIYVTSDGFIGKINLETGTYLWKHDGLHRQSTSAFNSFKKPALKENQVIFTEDPQNKRIPYQIVVDNSSGKIVKNTSP